MRNKSLVIILFFLLAFLFSSVSLADEMHSRPVLRINTEMHTAIIRQIDADASGKYIVTCSDDKTAIIWDAAKGNKLKTLRPPIGTGRKGSLYAIAISPDGKYIVSGGWTGNSAPENNAVYIFDAATGEIIRTISRISGVITKIVFSKDGKFFVVATGTSSGIYVYSAASQHLVTRLSGYNGAVYGAAFSPQGYLVTTSYDGKIRLYSKQFQLINSVEASGGTKPHGAAFSFDGTKIAIGFSDVPLVNVLSAANLLPLYKPVLAGIQNSFFTTVAWSKDGKRLYAGGTYNVLVRGLQLNPVRVWGNAGRGQFVDIPAGLNLITDIKILPDESIVFASAQPDFGKYNSKGKRIFYKRARIFSYSGPNKNHLLVNTQGDAIGFTPSLHKPFTFSIKSHQLFRKPFHGVNAVDQRQNVIVTDWQNSSAPRIDENLPRFLETGEVTRSVSVSATGKYIVFGTDWNLYCLDKKGKRIWKIQTPESAHAVNITPDEKKLVAAFEDGTIRWYRLSDGKELLSLFVHDDGKRWVLWSASGYFDFSVGAQNLIGWQINNGSNKATDFYPVGRFAEKFYRPDITAKILDYLNENRAVIEANKNRVAGTSSGDIFRNLPPIVSIASPENRGIVNSAATTITAVLKTPNNDPITEIKALINGRPSDYSRTGLNISSQTGVQESITLTLNPGENTVSIIAKNSSGWSSPANLILVLETTVQETSAGTQSETPNLYILAVGISDYRYEDLKLKFPAKDAGDFISIMQKQQGKYYTKVNVRVLKNNLATRQNIMSGLDWIKKVTTAKDIAMIFISGHGMNGEDGSYYFLNYDADINKLKETGLPGTAVSQTIRSIKGKVLYFMDTCYSGNIRVTGRRDLNGAINDLSSAENGAVVFASSTGRQASLESPEWGNGAFTKALIEAMSGRAGVDYLKMKVTVNRLDLWLSDRVSQITSGRQTPVTAKPDTIPDFTIAIIR